MLSINWHEPENMGEEIKVHWVEPDQNGRVWGCWYRGRYYTLDGFAEPERMVPRFPETRLANLQRIEQHIYD